MADLLVACRPALVVSNTEALDREFAAARWAYHRLLDFEDLAQRRLDDAQELCAPGISRVGRILSRLRKRNKRRERSTRFVPVDRPALRATLETRLASLRKTRNADPRWKEALRWARECEPDAVVKSVRRKAGETDEAFAERQAKGKRRSRREAYRVEVLYPQIRCHADTWNALVKSADQAVAAVLKQRAQGMPAEWRRPKWDDPNTIVLEKLGSYRIVERGSPWWIIDIRTKGAGNWSRIRAKFGNWHGMSADAVTKQLKLTRRKNGQSWSYSASLTVDGAQKSGRISFAKDGVVALDWGHREHQHPGARNGIRVFYWRGDDGREGEILLPSECRELKDLANKLKSRVDDAFNARKATLGLDERNRYRYRSRLMRSGVRSQEEQAWLSWEMRYQRRLKRCRERVENLRSECYTQAIRQLRASYKTFVFEDESTKRHQQLDKDEQTRHRKRENRDMSARYLFVSRCERFGADIITVTARNSTRECPDVKCNGVLPNNGPELMAACPACGVVRDKDQGAATVILRRGQEAIAKRDVAA